MFSDVVTAVKSYIGIFCAYFNLTFDMEKSINCYLCGTNSKDANLGEMYGVGSINVHGNCLIFSHGIRQNSNKTVGLYGFEESSIKQVFRRARDKECAFCERKGATVKCCEHECNVRFHLPCGIPENESKTLHLFYGSFKSFCMEHAWTCIFEGDRLTGIYGEEDLVSCCRRLFYHKDCMKKFAITAKESSVCPNCRNREKFQEFIIKNLDVTIPEGEPDYAELPNFSYNLKCVATKCVCKKGRLFHNQRQNAEYEIISCIHCGSEGIHRLCGNVGIANNSVWICSNCRLENDDRSILQLELSVGKLVACEKQKIKEMNHVFPSISENYHETKFRARTFLIRLPLIQRRLAS